MTVFRCLVPVVTCLLVFQGAASAQTWVDSLDRYAREEYLPAGKYMWTWQRASLLRAMVIQYEMSPAAERGTYLEYVRTAMDATARRAHGKRPNAVASGHGMAFLARVTGERRYAEIADRIYRQFLDIVRTANGGVSHKMTTPELWDDTVYMIGVFLLEMYRATGDERYLNDLLHEIRVHRAVLRNEEWGLWVHGWDGDGRDRMALCGQRGWPDAETRRSAEIWGRGNGWVIVTLSDAVRTVPRDHAYWPELAGYLTEMTARLPELQDTATGHWFQLPVLPEEPGNFIESTSTAMFAYGLLTAYQAGLGGETYRDAAGHAYRGLRAHSIVPLDGPWVTVTNVCKGTCIGDRDYYFNRKSVTGKPFGLAMLLTFGLAWEQFAGLR